MRRIGVIGEKASPRPFFVGCKVSGVRCPVSGVWSPYGRKTEETELQDGWKPTGREVRD